VRRLGVGRGISITGREAAAVALAVLAWQQTGSGRWVAAVLLASQLGFVAGTPVAGWLADHRDRRRVMVGADLAGAGIALAFLVPLPLSALVALAALAALVEAPFGASSRALLPLLVPDAHLDDANASLSRIRTVGFLAGPLLGGAGAAAIGAHAVFALNAASFMASAALVRTISPPARPLAGAGARQASGGLLAGARALASHPALRTICGAWMVARVGSALEMTAAIALGHDEGPGGVGVGLLVGSFAVGSLAGASVAPAALRRLTPGAAVCVSLGLLALGLAITGLAPIFAGVLAGGVVAGVGDGCSCIAEEGALQRWVPGAVLGRAMASYDALLAVATIGALAGAGTIVAAVGAQAAYVLAAAICAAAAALVGVRELAAAGREPVASTAG
jgi:MFS family permease